MRGSQLTSDPSSQTFSDPATLPLFQKFEVKVSRSLLVNVAGRILKCLWIISSVKKVKKFAPCYSVRARLQTNEQFLKSTFLGREMLVERATSPVFN